MNAQLRTLRIVQAAMLLAAIVYIFFAESLTHRRTVALDPTIYFAMAIVAAGLVGGAFLVRQSFIGRSAEVLQTQPDDSAARFGWFKGYFVIFAMCEAIVLIGFVLRILGATLPQVTAFYIVGIILLLLFSPRKP